MALLTWSDSYSVKVAEIDRQHQQLVKLINDLHSAMLERKAKDTLGKIIDQLAGYTVNHFATEEKYFAKFNYPETASHKKEHENFVAKVSDFKKGFDDGRILLSMDIMNFLKDWLVKHIQGTDQKYSDFFNKNGLK